MKAIIGLLLGIVVGLALAPAPRAVSRAEQADPAVVHSKAQMEAARKTFVLVWKNYQEGRSNGESVYWWSRRWMESERQLSDKKADQIAAIQAHRERMRKLEQIVRDLQRGNNAAVNELTAAEFYRLEAETWLKQVQ
ncbi:MAG: hypothetical protein K2R98_02850 [Gemmataceae bacterium]|nr:hypothetical protein [Gemmataceae bacterium]